MAVLEMKEIFYAYEKGRPVLSNVNTQFSAPSIETSTSGAVS